MDALLQELKNAYPGEMGEKIEKAWYFAQEAHKNQQRKSGELYVVHPRSTAKILTDLDMDGDTIVAALLHDVMEDTDATYEDLVRLFGPDVAALVDGVTKLGLLQFSSREEAQAESIRKMLLAMAKDIRVILIKLADRLHNMRTLDFLPPDKQLRISKQTLEIYAPIAHRLGIGTIKGELEDLAFKYLDPQEYQKLSEQMEQSYEERQASMDAVKALLTNRLADMGIKAKIDGRQKHLYSTHRKMLQQQKDLTEIYDTVAIRVILESVKDCYAVLGLVHTIWRPLPGRFKDYIAVPKANMYQSLHTTLIGDNGTPFEVQIRTFEMHSRAEYGIAAHWKYKEGKTFEDDADTKLTWLRQMLEWQNEMRDPTEFMDSLKIDLFSDTVFVFTPMGDVIDLPKGSTPLDFAFNIHSAVGYRCTGAKVNGRIATLDSQLKTGDIVEIITSSSSHGPSRDWLQIVKTQAAKNKIRQWFKRENKEENIAKGKDMLEKEAKRHGYALPHLMRAEWLEPFQKRYSLQTLEDIYAAVGYGGLSTGQVLQRLIAEAKQEDKQRVKAQAHKYAQEKPGKYTSKRGILVKGEADMMVRFAKCCNPVPGDDIVGYITRGRGVSVHRSDCSNLKDILDNGGVFVEVSWADAGKSSYLAEVQVSADDRAGLILGISQILASMNINLAAMNARNDSKAHRAVINMTLEIQDTQQLDKVIRNFKKIDGVDSVFRVNA
ncbi:MAG: RelA/SpoT family protein [Christensenellales bacterium]|jgi:guanosine-3',5'-bis(diphosphate) 3'-pyrophosphohydrolase